MTDTRRLPVRAITTTTISILAVGLLAGSAVGVAAQDEEAAADVTSFTGTGTPVDFFDGEEGGTVAVVSYESSDPRLTGEVTITGSHLADPDAAGFTMLSAQAYELTNDGGSWLGEGTGVASTDLGIVRDTFILVGQEGYEGLTAYVISEDPSLSGNLALSGLIFPSAMPEVPEPYVAE
jgi:hypothetical protein